MASGKKKYELEIMIAGGTDASLAASIQKAKREISGLERRAGVSSNAIGESFGGMGVKGINALGRASDLTFGAIAKGSKLAAAGVVGILGASTIVGMGFEAQMSTVGAISQASAEDMRKLNALAKEMGKTTEFSAEEAGQGLEYMAMAGWKAKDMVDALPGVMNLAAASGEELGIVSDIVTDAMTAMKMSADGTTKIIGKDGFVKEVKNAAHFADVLAAASSNSNTNVALLGESFRYCAPLAGAYEFSVEDTALTLGLMANSGIKASQSGTAFRKILTQLSSDFSVAQKDGSDFVVTTTNADGTMRSLKDILDDTRTAFNGMTEAEKKATENNLTETAKQLEISLTNENGTLKTQAELYSDVTAAMDGLTESGKVQEAEALAGKTAMAGLLSVVNASEKDYEKLAEAIYNCDGAAERMAEIRLDNMAGDLTLLKSAAQGAGIEIYEGFSGALRGLTQDATAWVGNFTTNITEDIPTIRRNMKEFGQGIREGLGPLIELGGWCMKHPDIIKGTIAGIVTAMGTFKIVQGASAGFKMLSSLSSMLSAWPVAAFGLAAGAIIGIVTTIKETNKRLKKEDMAKRFGSIKLSIEELNETAKRIVDNGNMEKAAEAIEEMGKVKNLAKDFEDANKSLNKLNWKIGMNFGLDEEDKDAYAVAIDQMVKGSIQIVEQSQYTAQISVQALFGEGSEKGNELLEGFNAMYNSINIEIQELGRQLGDAYSAAMEDGIIDIDEAKTIQELQKKLADITQQVSHAQFDAKMERIAMQYSAKELDSETAKNLMAEMHEAATEQKAALQQSVEWNIASVDMEAERENKSQEWVEKQKQSIQDSFNEQQLEIDMRVVSFSSRSITDAYKDVLDEAVPDIKANLDQAMVSSMQTASMGNMVLALDPDVLKRSLGLDEIDEAARDGISEYWNTMQPDYEQLQATARSYLEAGKEIPKSVADGLNDAAMIGAIAGNQNAIMHLMAVSIANNPEYKAVLEQARKDGAGIPEEIAAYMDNNHLIVEGAVNQLGDATQRALDSRFSRFSVDGTVDVNLKTNIGSSANRRTIKRTRGDSRIDHYAEGGLIQSPTLSWFAEDGPEMAIPLNGSARSMELWRETGELLGAYEANNYAGMYENLTTGVSEDHRQSTFAPVFSPVINVEGKGNISEQVTDGIQAGFDKFVEYMEKYEREKYRAAF